MCIRDRLNFTPSQWSGWIKLMNSLNESCLGFNPCDAQNASSRTKQPLSNLQAYVIPPSMANDNVSFSSANAIRAVSYTHLIDYLSDRKKYKPDMYSRFEVLPSMFHFL